MVYTHNVTGSSPVSCTTTLRGQHENAISFCCPRSVHLLGEYSSIGRASDCGSEGCGIVPHYSPHIGIWCNGSIRASKALRCEFESYGPCQKIWKISKYIIKYIYRRTQKIFLMKTSVLGIEELHFFRLDHPTNETRKSLSLTSL